MVKGDLHKQSHRRLSSQLSLRHRLPFALQMLLRGSQDHLNHVSRQSTGGTAGCLSDF